jgi:lipid A 3-O-deacylase
MIIKSGANFMLKKILMIFITGICFSPECFSSEKKSPGDYNTITFYMENDFVSQTDSQYTSGVKLTWISKKLNNYCDPGAVPGFICSTVERLPFMNEPGFRKNISFSIGQNIYTPDDTARKDLIMDDRPYAGVSYLALGFLSKNKKRMDTIEINAGIVGPHSYAQKMQFFFHRMIGSKKAKGWANQLKDEPVLDLFYERKWRVASSDLGNGIGYDLIPHAGLSVGNLLTAAVFGGEMRFGLNVPSDFGTLLIRHGSDTNAPVNDEDPRFSADSSPFGIHLFLGLDASVVARDIFLDGNTFSESHSVHKKPFVYRSFGGIGMLIHRVKITCAGVWASKNFDTQKRSEKYGSLTVSYSY